MLPLMVDLHERSVLVIGAGKIGVRKAAQLLEQGANVSLVATEVLAELPEGISEVLLRPVVAQDLDGRVLVVSATGNPSVDDQVRLWATERNILLNAVDDPARCDFYFMAQHRQGPVVLAVSSEGAAPALAQVLRDRAAAALPSNLAEVAEVLRSERTALHDAGTTTEGLDWHPRITELLNEK